MTEQWGVRDESQEWEVSVRDGWIVVTRLAGPFRLPAGEVRLRPESAGSVAKAIVSARNSTRTRKRRADNEGEQRNE